MQQCFRNHLPGPIVYVKASSPICIWHDMPAGQQHDIKCHDTVQLIQYIAANMDGYRS